MYQKQHKSRQEHVCSGCGNIIGKRTSYTQIGLIPNNRDYHEECLPKSVIAPIAETKVKTEYKPARDAKGRFMKGNNS